MRREVPKLVGAPDLLCVRGKLPGYGDRQPTLDGVFSSIVSGLKNLPLFVCLRPGGRVLRPSWRTSRCRLGAGCGEAESWLFVGFLTCYSLFHYFAGISPEFRLGARVDVASRRICFRSGLFLPAAVRIRNTYIYIYISKHICDYMYIYIYTHIYIERER